MIYRIVVSIMIIDHPVSEVMLLVPAVIVLMEMHKKVKRHIVLFFRCFFTNIRFMILFPCMGVILFIVSAWTLGKKFSIAIASSVIRN